MSDPSFNRDRLEELVLSSVDASFSDADRAELNALLRDDAAARAFAAEMLRDDALLSESLATAEAEFRYAPVQTTLPSTVARFPFRTAFWIAGAAAACLVLALAVLSEKGSDDLEPGAARAEAKSDAADHPPLEIEPPVERPVNPTPTTEESKLVVQDDPALRPDRSRSRAPAEGAVTVPDPPKPEETSEPMIADTEPALPKEPVVSDDSEPVMLGSVWSIDDLSGSWEPGEELATGEYTINRGAMEIRLDSGVRLIVVGPTRFALLSDDRVRLDSGKLSAEVFPMAKGFTVTANSVEVIDLGTRFAVSANTQGDVAVHVFDGTAMATVGDTASEPSTVRSGDTVRLDLESHRLRPIRFQQTLFAPRPARTGAVEEHSKTVRLLDRPPRAANRPALFPGTEAVLIRERSGIVLRRALEVNLAGLGEGGARRGVPGTIPEGAELSSYLIHFDSDDPKVISKAEATIRFDSPILGVIYTTEGLLETDRSLGASRTDYPESAAAIAAGRGLEVEHERIPDDVRLHDDGRTISFKFLASQYDQARILVAEDSDQNR